MSTKVFTTQTYSLWYYMALRLGLLARPSSFMSIALNPVPLRGSTVPILWSMRSSSQMSMHHHSVLCSLAQWLPVMITPTSYLLIQPTICRLGMILWPSSQLLEGCCLPIHPAAQSGNGGCFDALPWPWELKEEGISHGFYAFMVWDLALATVLNYLSKTPPVFLISILVSNIPVLWIMQPGFLG